MGLGFYLTGNYDVSRKQSETSPDQWLEQVASWLEVHSGEPFEGVRQGHDREKRPGVFAQLHPCAEELEIIVPKSGRVISSAKAATWLSSMSC
jgi:hypothetical protein